MRYITIIFGTITICVGGILTFLAPDFLSIAITGIMTLIILLGVVLGIVKDMLYYQDFKRASHSIIMSAEAGSSWRNILENESLFSQKNIYDQFSQYKEKAEQQRNNGQIINDIEETFNEDTLFINTNQSLISQIPGTLTSLGILGTFIGLIVGLRGISFDNAETAMEGVATLLNGIETAFYTSICGVILSILFNLANKIAWNMTIQEMNRFTMYFHNKVIPPVQEQNRYRDNQKSSKIIQLLEYIANKSDQKEREEKSYEQILMPQIAKGLDNKEFICCFQPVLDLVSKAITKLEVVIKWNHSKLGLLSPSVFIPTVIHTGYGPKLERYIWEELFKTIKNWLDRGVRPPQLIIPITKNGLFSKDAPEAFVHLSKKYQVPPKYIYVGIPQEVYIDLLEMAKDLENRFLNNGFNVCIDQFNGDLFPVITNENIQADMILMDTSVVNEGKMKDVIQEANACNLSIISQEIKSMEQISLLRKCGFKEGSGSYFYDSMISEDTIKLLPGGDSLEEK